MLNQRIARSAQDVIKTLPKTKATTAQKRAMLRNLLASDNGLQKVGQGMVGPILMRLQYEGIARNILQEDPLEKGAGMYYDVATDVGTAYILDGYGAQVQVQEFEGKRVRYETFPVSAYPQILKEDLYALRLDILEYAQNEATQGIMRKEDGYLIDILDTVVENSANVHNPIAPQMDGKKRTVNVSGELTWKAILQGARFADASQLSATNLIMHPATARDIQGADLVTLGVEMKDAIMSTGAPVTRIGEFNILKSVMVPYAQEADATAGTAAVTGKVYMVPEAQYLGMMPVLWSLDTTENNKPEERKFGWVMDEDINMVVLNPFGVSRIDILTAEESE